MYMSFLIGFLITVYLITSEANATELQREPGEVLFLENCAGCHINGGNIIRRGKSLKLNSLKKNGINSPEDIAKIAREGVGIMSGYEELLGKGGDKLVSIWIWNQAQNAWIQG